MLARWLCPVWVAVAVLVGLAGTPAFASTATTTTLAVTPASPANPGTVATLTASVKETGGTNVTLGTVLFYDSFAPNLPIGTAQLTNAGQASMRMLLGVGNHGFTAKFVPTIADAASTSTVQTLVIVGTGSYASSVSLNDNTSNGNNLNVSAQLKGAVAPNGNVTIHSSVTNSSLGTVTLTPTSFGQSLPTTFPTPTTGIAVITADFNGDGFADLAEVTSAGKVDILLGHGDGTFGTAAEYAVGSGAVGIVAGDFNHDGKVDLAVTNKTDSTVSILIGVGDGTFLGQATFTTGPSPIGIATADMDGDGKLDLIVADSGSVDTNGDAQVEIFTGKGDGTFVATSTKMVLTTYQAEYVAVGDLNGDGLPDIAVSSQPSVLMVILQKADRTFLAPVTYFCNSGLRGVTIADFNNDGKPDILVNEPSTSDFSGQVDILIGHGDGTFANYVGYPSSSAATNAIVGDFNHDGILDYAVGSNTVQQIFGNSLITFGLGVGDGTFGNSIQQSFSIKTVDFPQYIAAADFTGSGLLGVVAVGQENNVSVNLGYQTATGTLPNITVIQEDTVTGSYIPGTGDAYAGSISPSLTLEPPSYYYSLAFEGNPSEVDYTTGDTPAPLTVIVEQNSVRSATAAFPVTLTVKGPTGANAVYNQTTVAGSTTFQLPVLTVAGTYNLTAHSASAGSDASLTFVVAAGAQTATSLFITSPYPSHASKGTASPVTLSVLDQFGNADVAFTGTVTLTTTDGAALVNPVSYTFAAADNGVKTFNVTFNTLGTQSLTFASAGLTSVTQAGIRVLPPSVTTLSFSSTPVNSLSPVSLQATVTVAGVPATRGTVNFYDSFSSPKLIATGQLNAKGQVSIVIVLGAGTHPIVATFTGNSNAGASTSASQTLLVTPKQNYVSTNLINAGNGNPYLVADGAGFYGRPRPTGTVNFVDNNHLDTNNKPKVLDTEQLGSSFYSFTVNTVDTPVGIAPFAIVKGDFNGDGVVDVATVNSNSTDNTVSVLLGNSGLAGQINPDGTVNNVPTFASPLIYAVGSRPAAIVTGDFNADGKLDIAVANTGDGTVSVLYGKGDGTFQPAVTLTVGNAPVGIAAGDIDGDGNLDLVVANSGDGTLSVLRGNGDGTFQPQTTITVGSGPQNLVLADFNGDGSLDIAVANGISNTVSVLLGKGDGTFKPATVLPTGSSPFAVAAMDVAGSGKVSLAVSNLNDGTVSFYQGNGDGTFQTTKTLTVGSLPTAFALGDFYANGFVDLAVASSGDQANTVAVFSGYPDSQGNYINGAGSTLAAVGPNPQGIVAADVSGVGLPGLVIAGKSASNQYDGLVSRPAISVLPILQTIGVTGGLGVGIVDTDSHFVSAVYVPGANDAYEGSSSSNSIDVPGTLQIQPQVTKTPAGPLVAGVAFPNVTGQADQAGQLDSNYTGTLTLRVAGVDSSYSQSYTQTAVAGKASFAVPPFTKAGTYRFLLSLPGSGETYVINSDVLVVAAAASQLVISTPFISPAARGVGGVVGVAAEDTYGNVVTNFTGTVSVSTSDTAAVIKPASHTFVTNDAGFASFAVTFNTTGTQSITASGSGLTSATQSGIVVIAPQLSTTTTLAFTPASPQPAETAVTLTATVKDSTNTPITLGVVNFYDTAASPTLFATAPLTGTGTASIKINFPVGTHGISATFQPKNADQGSSSGTQTLVISPAANYLTQTLLSFTGTPNSYSLLANVGAVGAVLPTGNVTFIDTSNGNAVLGTAPLGTGSSAFAPQVPYTVAGNPSDVIQADFNGDGKLDLVTLNFNSVTFLPGNGDGTFGTVKTSPIANGSATHMVSGDLNGDGLLDLAIVNADGTASILLGKGDGTFQTAITVPALLNAGTQASYGSLAGIAVGDFNRDGKLDMAVSNVVDGTVAVLLGYGDGTFQHPVFYAGETGPVGLAVGDLNNDGYPDIVVANSNGDTVSVLLGQGDGTFGQQTTYAVDTVPTQVAIADFNGDGKPDVAVTNQASGTVSVLLGKGDGTLLPAKTSATGNGPTNLITGDFDGDGKQDIVVINQTDSTAALLLGKGDGTLGAPSPFTTAAAPDGLAAGDFTGSGRLSLAVAGAYGTTLSVLLGEEIYPAPLTPVSFTGTGLHVVKAVYNTGTADAYASSTSATINLYGKTAPIPTVAVTSSKSPAAAGASVTLTATVSSTTAGTITGSVKFYDGTTLLGSGTLASGTASISVSTLALGAHSITGVYSGDATYANATSPVFQQVIGAIATSLTTLVSSSNPAIVGQSITFTATVTSTTAGTPTGTVQFFSDGTSIGTGTLNGSAVATASTSTLVFGNHSITSVYSGDTNFQTSTAFAITQAITKTPTTTLLAVQFTQIENYGPDNYTATVAPASGTGTPTGQVDFSDGTTDLGKVTLNASGVAVMNGFPDTLGAHNIVATYLGDATYAGSASPTIVVSVTPPPQTTVTTATATPNPTDPALGTTFSITVTGSDHGIPTGTVGLYSGFGYTGNSATLDGTGKASITISTPTAGSFGYSVQYVGDLTYQASTSANIRVDVAPDATTPVVIMKLSKNPVLSGQPEVFTITVKAVSGGPPTGTVTLADQAGFNPTITLATITLNNGVGTFTTSSLPVSDFHELTATYNGDSTFKGGGSDFAFLEVDQGPTLPSTTTLTASPNPVTVGGTVLLTATVTAQSSLLPTGTVTFYDGVRLLATQPLNASGVATFSISSLPAGSHPITAAYNGDSFFSTSVATATALTVGSGTPTATTTTLSSTLNPSTHGASVTFNATVAPTSGSGAPTGSISFMEGATVLGTGTLSGGHASYTTSGLSTATHNVTAVYSGDGSFATSTSTVLAQVVNKAAAPGVALTTSAATVAAGVSVTFTATLTSAVGPVTGTVNFMDGGTELGSGTITAGVATYATSALSAGTHTITAVYGGDVNFPTVTSSPLTETITKPATTVALTTSAASVAAGTSVTFTATVATTATGTPTGTVSFFDGATLLGSQSMTGLVATYTTSSLTTGSHSITATYSGDATFATSTSSVLTQTITAVASSSTTAVTSSLNPAPAGTSVTFTATVTVTGSTVPTGNVSFYDGATLLGSTALLSNKTAAFSTSTLSAGSHNITAAYAGDTNFNGSTSAILVQVISGVAAHTSTSLVSSLNPSTAGASVTFTATLNAEGQTAPSGNINFFDGATQLGSIAISPNKTAAFTTSALTGGSHTITATYVGDANYATSTSPALTQVVNAIATATSVVSSLNPSTPGASVTFTATVNVEGAIALTGNVSFFDGATLLGSTAITANKTATFTTSTLAAGSHTITATYAGDANYVTSTSQAVTQVVNTVATTTAVTSSLNPSPTGGSVTFTATVSTTGTITPTGNISFFDGATLLGSTAITANKTATFTTSSLAIGSHTITATYAGDTNYVTSTSAALTQVVGAVVTTTAVTSSLNPSVIGQSVTFTATVSTTGTLTATGNINFLDGATVLGSIAITANKTAAYTTSALAVGSHTITATYVGDTNYVASTSTAVTQVVNKAVTAAALTSSANPSTPGQSVTFTATLSSTTAGTQTGTVVFNDGATVLSTVTLTSNVATYTTTALATGSHTITATYSGDATFGGVTSPGVTQVVAPLIVSDFALSVPTGSQTINPGGIATYTIAAASVNGAFNNAVTMSVTGLPAGATAAFAPATITPGATSGASVLTIHVAPLSAHVQTDQKLWFAALLLLIPAWRRRSRSLPRLAAVAVWAMISLGAVMGITGCGGGFFGQAPQTYTLTITGTSGTTTHSTTTTLQVQ